MARTDAMSCHNNLKRMLKIRIDNAQTMPRSFSDLIIKTKPSIFQQRLFQWWQRSVMHFSPSRKSSNYKLYHGQMSSIVYLWWVTVLANLLENHS